MTLAVVIAGYVLAGALVGLLGYVLKQFVTDQKRIAGLQSEVAEQTLRVKTRDVELEARGRALTDLESECKRLRDVIHVVEGQRDDALAFLSKHGGDGSVAVVAGIRARVSSILARVPGHTSPGRDDSATVHDAAVGEHPEAVPKAPGT